jgi:transposase InsO family protein
VHRVLTDNGNGYRARRFARACRTWQVRHKFTRPYTPRTNGKAERFIQTLLREWAYRSAYVSSAARTAALPRYMRYYILASSSESHSSCESERSMTSLQIVRTPCVDRPTARVE